jgi:hypothetical protein
LVLITITLVKVIFLDVLYDGVKKDSN